MKFKDLYPYLTGLINVVDIDLNDIIETNYTRRIDETVISRYEDYDVTDVTASFDFDRQLPKTTIMIDCVLDEEKSYNSPFKVGDKVRILVLSYADGEPLYPIGTIGTIINIDDDGTYEIHSDEYSERGWWYNEGDFELVEEQNNEH